MARLLGPDQSSRLITQVTSYGVAEFSGRLATVYSDTAGTVLADIATYDGTTTPGSAVAGSQVRLDSTSRLPRFWYPVDGTDVLYVRPSGGPLVQINADAALVSADITGTGTQPRVLWQPPRTRTWPASAPALFATPADSTMQTGHHWTCSNNGAGDLNYTTDYGLGTQCVKVTTTGTGSANQSILVLARQSATDMTGKAVRALIKLDAASYPHLAYLKYYVGGGVSAFTWFNNGTLATGADDPAHYLKPGEWAWVTMTAQLGFNQTGSPDLTQIRDFEFTIADDGTAPVTVLFGGFEIFAQDNATYPNGVISLTFDDSYLTQDLARQYMDKYRYPGTAYIIRDRIGADNSLWWTIPQLLDLQNKSGWEIAVHCDTAADHASPWGFQTLGLAPMVADLLAERRWMHDNGLRGGYGLALPKGGWDLTLMPELKRQFSYVAGVTSNGRIYGETLPPADPYRLRRYLPANDTAITPNGTRNTIEWAIDQTKAAKCWLILGYHNIVTGSPVLSTDYRQSDLQTTIDYIAAAGVPVRTVGDVLGIGR